MLSLLVLSHACLRKELHPAEDFVRSPLPHTYTAKNDLPGDFSWGDVNGVNYLTAPLNQHIPTYCGSCWLHSATSALNDRFKIKHKANGPDVMLGRQVILNCGTEAGTCKGGSDQGVYEHMRKVGLPDETCQQYDATDHECSDFRTCMNCDFPADVKKGHNMCYPVQRYTKYFVEEWGKMETPSVHEMKSEIFRRGPITCSVDSSPLENGHYMRGSIVSVMQRPDGKDGWETDHLIGIYGWGMEDGVEYWKVRNSWGRYWGEDGMFRVKMGKNVMDIESECAWAVPGESVTKDYGPSDASHDFPTGNGGDELIV